VTVCGVSICCCVPMCCSGYSPIKQYSERAAAIWGRWEYMVKRWAVRAANFSCGATDYTIKLSWVLQRKPQKCGWKKDWVQYLSGLTRMQYGGSLWT